MEGGVKQFLEEKRKKGGGKKIELKKERVLKNQDSFSCIIEKMRCLSR